MLIALLVFAFAFAVISGSGGEARGCGEAWPTEARPWWRNVLLLRPIF
jgi:hypothetical protein